jgi:hypothetical protein
MLLTSVTLSKLIVEKSYQAAEFKISSNGNRIAQFPDQAFIELITPNESVT